MLTIRTDSRKQRSRGHQVAEVCEDKRWRADGRRKCIVRATLGATPFPGGPNVTYTVRRVEPALYVSLSEGRRVYNSASISLFHGPPKSPIVGRDRSSHLSVRSVNCMARDSIGRLRSSTRAAEAWASWATSGSEWGGRASPSLRPPRPRTSRKHREQHDPASRRSH
jgi:hypothetical protein